MRLFFRALVLWLAASSLCHAEWQIVSSERRNPPNDLVEHRQVEVRESEIGARATLHFASFRVQDVTLKVIDQPAAPRGDLAAAMEQEDALAGVNGG